MERKKDAESRATKNDTTPCGVVGYVRVSTEDQVEGGISLDAQRRRVAAYCESQDLVLSHIEADEGISGKATRNRPGLQRALRALKRREASGLVTVKLDRLSRTTRDVLDLVAAAEHGGWALHSIEERLDASSPHGRFVVTVLAALAQLEREQAAQRTRAAMAELRRQGRRTSRFPRFGYRIKGEYLVPADKERQVLKEILALRTQGLGPRRIAAALNMRGVTNPRSDRPWHYGSIKAILRTVARHGPPH